MNQLIGRLKEQEMLLKACASKNSEFVAVYGRRRVGKTFRIRETFDYKFTFQHAGMAHGGRNEQLAAWNVSLQRAGLKEIEPPKNWLEAFSRLGNLIDHDKNKKKIIFIDEMPWLDTPRSKFTDALEFFWNSWASSRRDVVLIVCGSATSWIINNVIHSHGGLHNRVTLEINLQPFTLNECELFVKKNHLVMTRHQILETYMILGGIPYYWTLLDASKTLDQNIDNLFFNSSGRLRNEFNELYNSLFTKPEKYVAIITALSKKTSGLTRNEIAKACKEPNNGNLTKALLDLEQCRFIRRYNQFGNKNNNSVFQLIDNFTLFYFKFINGKHNTSQFYWSSLANNPSRNTSWNGLSFERVCLDHTQQIKKALGISGVLSNEYSWRSYDDGDSAQIDLVLQRKDDVIDLCEIKFWNDVFTVNKAYDEQLRKKRASFINNTKTRSSVRTILITTYGIKHNEYAKNIQQSLTADDLFC